VARPPLLRRSRYDREILRYAVPALGALAAEPLYLMVDTAIVGHIGTPQLAALALAATLLTLATTLCNFLTYGTTAHVARLHGARQEARAGEVAAQALWLALAIGGVLLAACIAFAGPLLSVVGGSGHVADLAARYLRISAIGLPCALIALSGQGYLRGVGDLRSPLVIVVAANAANVVLEVLFVYVFHWGLDGSAWGTVIAQLGMGAAFVVLLLRARAASRRPNRALLRSLLRMGGDIVVRTGALLGSFTIASAVLARVGAASLGAHQVAFGLFVFVALALDAIAIAGQVVVGGRLGAGDADGAYAAARRMLELALLAGIVLGGVLLALQGPLPRLFTDDGRVIERAQEIWPLFALMQPAAAVVFALDGVLIGAGDTRFLAWAMLGAAFGAYVPVALLALHFDWGIVGVWCGLLLLMAVRLTSLGWRFHGRRWAVTGAPAVA
jgi:MATE family, multidrug efflux pump